MFHGLNISGCAGCVHQPAAQPRRLPLKKPARPPRFTARQHVFAALFLSRKKALPDFPLLIRFISRTGRSKGDDTTEQITYTRQEAETLVERWADTILRVAYTWTGSVQDAQDICQTVLLKLLTTPVSHAGEGAAQEGAGSPWTEGGGTGAERMPGEAGQRTAELFPAKAFVLRVTINCCKDLKKSAWARKRVSLEAAADAAVTMPEAGESPVLEAVLALPEKYRQAIYLRYYEEYAVEEIASLMGCKAAQVSTYLYRGKAKLRTMLGGCYGQECVSD